ncbi:hypothetical protein [Streptomyces sp. NPDC047928]|uniref:hypothetical protein n=1 Tax=unclassified Streptomyces TaxID=2593676 RepID=UPI00371C7E88
MGGRAVAGEGDVTATVGTMPFTGADTGTWTQGTMTETASTTLKADGAFVLHAVTCVFDFQGTNSAGAAVKAASTVTLKAEPSLLRPGGRPVLLHGDSAEDAFGNRLKVASTRSLRVS